MRRELVGWSDIDAQGIERRLQEAPAPTVCIPIYNGGLNVARNLDAIARTIHHSVRARMVDDASTEQVVLDQAILVSERPNVDLLVRDRNVGYVSNVNSFLSEVPGDIILINSDATPGQGWIDRLRAVAYSRETPSIASAMSNNAGSASLPSANNSNEWSNPFGWAQLASRVGRNMPVFSYDYPTAHGFCMYIPREVITSVGLMDVESFPRGYGEEVDYSMRARNQGYATLFAPHVLVRHLRSQSFGADLRTTLNASAKQVLSERYPDLRAIVAEADSSPSRRLLAGIADRLQSQRLGIGSHALALVVGHPHENAERRWISSSVGSRAIPFDTLENELGGDLDARRVTPPDDLQQFGAEALLLAVRFRPDFIFAQEGDHNVAFAHAINSYRS